MGLINLLYNQTWRRKWQPTPVFLPGESLGQKSLEGYNPQPGKESDTIEVTAHYHEMPLTVTIKKNYLNYLS